MLIYLTCLVLGALFGVWMGSNFYSRIEYKDKWHEPDLSPFKEENLRMAERLTEMQATMDLIRVKYPHILKTAEQQVDSEEVRRLAMALHN